MIRLKLLSYLKFYKRIHIYGEDIKIFAEYEFTDENKLDIFTIYYIINGEYFLDNTLSYENCIDLILQAFKEEEKIVEGWNFTLKDNHWTPEI